MDLKVIAVTLLIIAGIGVAESPSGVSGVIIAALFGFWVWIRR